MKRNPHAMTPGGLTEGVANSGGHELFRKLAELLEGNPPDSAVFALTQAMIGIVVNAADTRDEADLMVDAFAADLENGLELNWDRRQVRRAANELVEADPAFRRQQ
jgi:hypothetical protein